MEGLNLYSVQSELTETKEIVLLNQKCCYEQKVLLLVKNSETFLSGLQATYYFLQTNNYVFKTLVYIEKVDSTGYTKLNGSVSPTKLVLNYFLKNLNNLPGDSLNLYIFARSQPQYLFVDSSLNKEKNVLSEKSLIKWWKFNLSNAFNDRNCNSFWFIPNEDINDLKEFYVKDDNLLDSKEKSKGLKWAFGWPYKDFEIASQCFPKFPDDPKVKALDLLTESQTVKQFSEVLGCLGEFSSCRMAGFFNIELKTAEPNPSKVRTGTLQRVFAKSKSF
ncbi:hypothetical protein HK099_003835 [Clydaea vesicula]|uniref:histone acetyltransferase n=1 Tax=Clydaea vesicula TaxID=447962 RepID=A0AAD5XYL0_9FUNG|nr:hypothetical protein HK099_003835 [Clydaea vesicula]